MKSILISINPKSVAKILNGKKIMEIRTTAPKCDLPIDVYVYCTKNGPFLQEEMDSIDNAGLYDYPTGVYAALPKEDNVRHGKPLNGKVVAKLTLKYVSDKVHVDTFQDGSRFFHSTAQEILLDALEDYDVAMAFRKRKRKEGSTLFSWWILDLQIFDRPKELWQFQKPGTHEKYLRSLEAARKDDLKLCEEYGFDQWDMREEGVIANGAELTEEAYKIGAYGLQRPPQSWQYVEEGE